MQALHNSRSRTLTSLPWSDNELKKSTQDVPQRELTAPEKISYDTASHSTEDSLANLHVERRGATYS